MNINLLRFHPIQVKPQNLWGLEDQKNYLFYLST